MAQRIFVLVFVAYAWFFGGAGWNQSVNFDLARAIVERGTIAIDAYATNTGDVSRVQGHVFSNKPPGVSFLAVVPYAVLYAIERASGVDPRSTFILIINLWLVTVAVCATSGALIASVIYLYARREVGATPFNSVVVVLVIAFGTYLFAYSTVLFMHVPNALFLLLAFTWARTRPVAAGIAAGAALLCNYVSAPAVLVLLWYGGRRNAIRFIAGAAPMAIALMVYQAVAFGSPFRTSVETTDPRFLDRGAWLGVLGLPDPRVLWEILIGRFRGLFYLSPVLAYAIAGIVVMIRRRAMRRELIAIGAIAAAFLLITASFNGWHGGSAIGPRYLLPIVPLLALPMLFAVSLWRPLFLFLAAISVTVNLLVVAVNPLPSAGIPDPIGTYIVPLFVTGRLPASIPREPLWSWKVMLGPVSVNRVAPDEPYPYIRHAPGSAEGSWASFNLGEIVAHESRASILPIALWILFGSVWLARSAATSDP